MTRLVLVELTRLRWRRAVVLLLATCFVVPALVLAGTAWNTRPVSADDIADARRQAAEEAARPWVREEVARCEESPEDYGGPGFDPTGCAAMIAPTPESYLYRPTLDVMSVRDGEGVAVVTILVALALIVGTTFAGHDWNTGSMGNQLLFEPRRLRIWAAKALAVTVVGLVTAAVVLGLFWGAVALLVGQRDVVVPDGVWTLARDSALRGVVVVALAGLGGYALTMLFRSTVATLALMFAVALGGSVLVLALLGQGASRWLLPTNFLAVLLGGQDYYDYEGCAPGGMGLGDQCLHHVSLADGSAYLGVILLVAVLLSVWSFRRRDVP